MEGRERGCKVHSFNLVDAWDLAVGSWLLISSLGKAEGEGVSPIPV